MKSISLLTLAAALALPLSAHPACLKEGRAEEQVLHASGKISIALPAGHPSRLLVYTPQRRVIYLVDDKTKAPWSPLEFSKLSSLALDADKLAGTTYVNGQATRRKVFEERGCYEFYLADNLETEPGNTNGISFFVEFK